MSAGFTKLVDVNSVIPGDDYSFARIVVSGLLGGTVSQITGGKFANGALTSAMGQALNGEIERLRYKQHAKSWRDAERLEAQRQARIKGRNIIRGQVGASYDGDNYLGYRVFDVVAQDADGQWVLTEVKFRQRGYRGHPYWRAYRGARTFSQLRFDLGATSDLTLKGKYLNGGSITLKSGSYRIQWVVVGDRGTGVNFTINSMDDVVEMATRLF